MCLADPGLILVVDDDDSMRALLAELIQRLFTPELARQELLLKVARDGFEAVRFAAADRPALILLDVQMPGKNGIDVFYQLKEEMGALMPVIFFLTGYALEGDMGEKIHQALDDGARGYVQKPIAVEELERLVRGHVLAKQGGSLPAPAPLVNPKDSGSSSQTMDARCLRAKA